MGRPESADKYNLKIDSQAVQVDETAIKQFAENAHKLGLNNQQAQGILEFYKSNLETDAQQARVDTETAQVQAEQELRKEWGRDFESKVQAAGAIAKANIGEEILDLELRDGTRIGDHPAIIKGFSKIAGMISEDTMVQPDTDVQDTAFDLEEEISTIINNTDGPYWNKQHPEHDKMVQRVYTLREMLNNAKPE
jgi:multidrug efflux pump subunit AcrA (membrane-fusion protein)